MATYAELAGITNDAGWDAFADKVRVAVSIKAAAVIDDGAAPAARLEWAKDALSNPGSAGQSVIFYVVSSNSNAAVSAIVGAADGVIQTNVNAAVDALYK